MFYLRILIGLIFLFSGGQKLINPYQNFLYVIQSYELIPIAVVEETLAQTLPWIEFILGLFVFSGLWLKRSLTALLALIASFLIVLAQAVVRHLPIDKCGCFGEMIKIPPPMMLLVDSVLWLSDLFLLLRIQRSSKWSLDNWFEK